MSGEIKNGSIGTVISMILHGFALISVACFGIIRSCSRVATHADDIIRMSSQADDFTRTGSQVGKLGQIGKNLYYGAPAGDDLNNFGQLNSQTKNLRYIERGKELPHIVFKNGSRYFRELESNYWSTMKNETIVVRMLPFSDSLTLQKYIKEPKVLALIPDNETAYINVYDDVFSASAYNNIKKTKRLFDELNFTTSISEDTFGRQQLLNMIQAKDTSNTIILVAHSEKSTGTVLHIKLLNGEVVSADEIHRVALESKKQCLILTCHGSDFSVRGKISMMEAYAMIKSGLKMFSEASSRGKLVLSDEFTHYVRLERTKRKAKQITITAVSSLSGGTGIHIVLSKFASDLPISRPALNTNAKKVKAEAQSKLFEMEAQEFVEQGDWLAASFLYNQAANLLEKDQKTSKKAMLYNRAAVCLIKDNQGEPAIRSLEKALSHTQEDENLIFLYNNLGAAYKLENRWLEALHNLCLAVELDVDENYHDYIFGHLSEVYYRLDDLPNAVQSGEVSLLKCLQTQNQTRGHQTTETLILVYKNLGNVKRVSELKEFLLQLKYEPNNDKTWGMSQ